MVQIPNPPVPTSADVARLAGVSRATVSYVLNNTQAVRISEPTRRRVREAAEQLGYVPHAAARTLRAGHSRTVVMPAPAFPAGPLYTRFIGELQRSLGHLDYTVVQYGAGGPHGDDAARAWAELRPIAVLVPGPGLGPRGVELLKRSGARAVVTFAAEAVDGAHALIMDHELVGRAAGRHLYERGRRRIGVVLPEDPGLRLFSLPRLRGVQRALRGTDAALTELPLGYEEEAAARLAARWDTLRLDAVFAYNDEYAMLLSRALQDVGIDIPGRTAVLGADDLVLGRLLRPRLSTVRLDLPAGRDLAALVDRAVREPGAIPERRSVLGVSVVCRDSS